jgi:hypothetical protein
LNPSFLQVPRPDGPLILNFSNTQTEWIFDS